MSCRVVMLSPCLHHPSAIMIQPAAANHTAASCGSPIFAVLKMLGASHSGTSVRATAASNCSTHRHLAFVWGTFRATGTALELGARNEPYVVATRSRVS